MMRLPDIYHRCLKGRCYALLFSFLLALSACSEYEHSIYDPLSPDYIDMKTPVGQEVNLGLSVNWANHNVGATVPHGYGGYYAWGETKMKHEYTEENYLYCADKGGWFSYTNIGDDISGTSYDVAHVRWGNGWRMPSRDEVDELCDKCTWEWTTVNGIKGYKVTGPNGNSIFLPAAGYRLGSELYGCVSDGSYWSSTLREDNSRIAYGLRFDSYDYESGWDDRYYGHPVRPVRDKEYKERTIAEIYKVGGGYSITKGVVIATSKQEVIIDDMDEGIIPVIVGEEHALTNGDSIIVKGTVSRVEGVLKFEAGCKFDVQNERKTVTNYWPSELDDAEVMEYIAAPYTKTVIYNGVLNYVSGKYYVIPNTGVSYKWCIIDPYDEVELDDCIGKKITVYGYATGVVNKTTINTIAKCITLVEEDGYGNLQILLNGYAFNMIRVAGGTFMMGAMDKGYTNGNDLPAHPVEVTDYYIAETEFTQGLHSAFHYGYNIHGSKYPRTMSYDYAETFIRVLGYATGLPFQLPTEAQWEFAARGGNSSMGYTYSGSNNLDSVGWYKLHPLMVDTTSIEVASMAPNELGIYDMSGNLSEWCSDWYGKYSEDTVNVVTNPTGPSEGVGKVTRGGDYYNSAYWCCTTARPWVESLATTYGNRGCRLCLDFSTEARGHQRNSTRTGEMKGLDLQPPTMQDKVPCIRNVSSGDDVKKRNSRYQ